MRFILGLSLVVFLSVVILKAQVFNLDDEDKINVVPTTQTTQARVPASRIEVPAAEVPVEPEDQKKLDKLYADIVGLLKDNNVKAATDKIQDYDVITKQKIIYRLMQENPNDFRQPASELPADNDPESEGLAPETAPSEQ